MDDILGSLRNLWDKRVVFPTPEFQLFQPYLSQSFEE